MKCANAHIARRTAAETLQAGAVFEIACDTLSAWRGCDIERALLGAAYNEDTRPRWWDRLKSGNLRLAAALARDDDMAHTQLRLLREYTNDVDCFLSLEVWTLLDSSSQELGPLLELRRSVHQRCEVPELCNGSLNDAKRLASEIHRMTKEADHWLACSAMLCCIHLARRTGDLLSYLIAFGAWSRACDPMVWGVAPNGVALVVYLGQYFSRVTLHSTFDDGVTAALRRARQAGVPAMLMDPRAVRNEAADSLRFEACLKCWQPPAERGTLAR